MFLLTNGPRRIGRGRLVPGTLARRGQFSRFVADGSRSAVAPSHSPVNYSRLPVCCDEMTLKYRDIPGASASIVWSIASHGTSNGELDRWLMTTLALLLELARKSVVYRQRNVRVSMVLVCPGQRRWRSKVGN